VPAEVRENLLRGGRLVQSIKRYEPGQIVTSFGGSKWKSRTERPLRRPAWKLRSPCSFAYRLFSGLNLRIASLLQKSEWWTRQDSNLEPRDYESRAPPLSYGSVDLCFYTVFRSHRLVPFSQSGIRTLAVWQDLMRLGRGNVRVAQDALNFCVIDRSLIQSCPETSSKRMLSEPCAVD
jgi:hypothetical protein